MEATTQTMSDAEKQRWFSTGYLANGVGSVDAEKHTLQDAAIIRVGEAMGHQMWIDAEMCQQVVEAAGVLADKGLKARFGHPDMCSDALGTFLGRWKGLRSDDDGVARGSLHLSSTAAESPRGDLRGYIESMAAKEPDHFGTSIVFSRDWDAEDAFWDANIKEVEATDDEGNPTGDTVRRFQSPDPANVKNLRHARLSAIHAADLVDDPAATDGMFSGVGGTELAGRVSEWLDTHPEVLAAFGSEPEMIEIVERYATELRPFIERYNANHPPTPAEPVVVIGPIEVVPAEPDATEAARIAELEALLQDREAAVERLTGEVDEWAAANATTITERDAALAERDAVTAERDALAAQVEGLNAEVAAANVRLAAVEDGAPPVSAEPAGEGGELTPWQRAQRK